MWTCPKCATKVDPSFDLCWQCGTSKDGVEDPGFIKADDAPPIVDEELAPAESPFAGDAPGVEIVECYQALSLMEAKFIANELVQKWHRRHLRPGRHAGHHRDLVGEPARLRPRRGP